MKYRIIENREGFYPQERTCFLFKWSYLDYTLANITQGNRPYSGVNSYEDAIRIIERRKEYLQSIKFKKIHNL